MAFSPSVIEKGLNAAFSRAINELERQSGAEPSLIELATQVPSSSAYEKYGWLGSVPSVRQWLGAKRAEQLEDYDYTIYNKDFEVSIVINQNDMADDTLGAHSIRVQDLVARLRAYPAHLISDLLINGDSDTAYDGIAFFSDVSSPRAIDNLLTGTGVTTSALKTDIQSAMTAMAAFTDDAGEPLNIVPDTIVCPVAISYTMLEVVNSVANPAATAGVNTYNPLYNRFRVIADARLDSDDSGDWYIAATRYPLKPFVFQLREAAKPEMERMPLTKNWVYSGVMRGNAGYAFPHLACKVTNT